MVVAGFALLSVLTLQAQDPGLLPHTQSDTLLKPGPVFLPEPTPDLWSHYNLTGIPDTLQLSDTIPQQLLSPALTDSMLWSHLYQDDFLEESPLTIICLLYTSPSPRDRQKTRMPSSA